LSVTDLRIIQQSSDLAHDASVVVVCGWDRYNSSEPLSPFRKLWMTLARGGGGIRTRMLRLDYARRNSGDHETRPSTIIVVECMIRIFGVDSIC
ncbi:hypothetical protein TNCV_2263451, partial [Trichonephila clavipes]